MFEGNQLTIYIQDPCQLDSDAKGAEFLHQLEELHSFPHPDLASYNDTLRNKYLEEYDLPYDLKEAYQAVVDQIQSDMSGKDIQFLINQAVPSICYTEKNGYHYYVIASPQVIDYEAGWLIQLFGQELFSIESPSAGCLIDQSTIEYEYVDGIQPN